MCLSLVPFLATIRFIALAISSMLMSRCTIWYHQNIPPHIHNVSWQFNLIILILSISQCNFIFYLKFLFFVSKDMPMGLYVFTNGIVLSFMKRCIICGVDYFAQICDFVSDLLKLFGSIRNFLPHVNIAIVTFSICHKSYVYNKYRSGPRTLPCWTSSYIFQ